MIGARLGDPDDFDAWRDMARSFITRGIPPEKIAWSEGEDNADLFSFTEDAAPHPSSLPEPSPTPVRASTAFLSLATSVFMHSDPARLDLLYRTLWRLQKHPRLIEDTTDADVANLRRLAQQVRRDIHKMRAFLRFRQIEGNAGAERYIAWFEPEYRIELANARFFVERFANQRWSILTPRLSLHWDGTTLARGPAASRAQAPADDAAEDLWRGYYRSIFNPARLKTKAMIKEMPRRYWHNLPEAREIAALISSAQRRETSMLAQGSELFAELRPVDLPSLAEGIAHCRRCQIGCNGTAAVPGEGFTGARLMIVGEQPGDNEELAGRPFVGPAGKLLNAHLAAAGIDRQGAYVTNAVKHFKFAARGKQRLHQNPTAREIDTCRWWLDTERALVQPGIVLALGASAARALTGRTPSIGRERGRMLQLPDGVPFLLTVHPSYLLRLDGPAREREEARFASDLAALAIHLRDPAVRDSQSA